MKPRSFPSYIFIACGISFLWSSAVSGETGFRSLDVGLKPESPVHGFGGKLYVTLMAETRVKGDGDGSIVMIDGDKVTTVTKGNLYLSEVLTGKVWHIPAESGEKRLLATLDSAADLILDDEKQELIVPNTKAGKLVFIPTGK